MADHVRVGIVHQNKIVRSRPDGLDQPVGDFMGRHLGLKVVGRNLGRWDKHTVFARERRFFAAIEEERHMGVFLGFGDPQLLFTGIRDEPGEDVVERCRWEHGPHIRGMSG